MDLLGHGILKRASSTPLRATSRSARPAVRAIAVRLASGSRDQQRSSATLGSSGLTCRGPTRSGVSSRYFWLGAPGDVIRLPR